MAIENITPSTNFLDFTNLTYREILDQIVEKLNADSNFENFRESQIAQMLIEIFAAGVDLNNYYLERRAEESYMETARLRSSVIQLAKQLGYAITRPIPAQSTIKITMKGPLPASVVEGATMQFPIYSEFLFDGNPYLFSSTYTYTFTSADVVLGVTGANAASYEKEIEYSLGTDEDSISAIGQLEVDEDNIPVSALNTIDIIQGEIRTKTILGASNPFVGKKFQNYKISDTTFSNKYGPEDYGAVDNEWAESDLNVTYVKVGSTLVAARNYEINRRTLISYESLSNQVQESDVNVCVIRTTNDDGVMVEFGDGTYAALGAKTGTENIYIQYLSTIGKKANAVGVIGKKLIYQNSVYVNNNPIPANDITANLEFALNTSIKNGADAESIDSIKLNSPALYYALDRLVTKGDYAAYLKSLTSPVNFKNAIAWGEQEEMRGGNPIFKLFNVALWSAIGSLYNTDAAIIVPKTVSATEPANNLSTAVLDVNDEDVVTIYDEPADSFFKTFVKANSPNDLGTSTVANVNTVNAKLNTRSQITARNVYVSPFIRDFDITGNVYVGRFADATSVSVRIANAVYEFLDENADFNKAVYLSNITEVIEKFREVQYTNIAFSPAALVEGQTTVDVDALYNDSDFNAWATSGTPVGNETAAAVSAAYVQGATDWWNTDLGYGLGGYGFAGGWTGITAVDDSNVTEYSFNVQLMKRVYDNLLDLVPNESDWPSSFANSTYFDSIMAKMRNSLLTQIRNNMIDSDGNITSFSIRNEVPKFSFTATTIINT